ncbi:hypothetical protein AgCh_022441 [Apium graveolens]
MATDLFFGFTGDEHEADVENTTGASSSHKMIQEDAPQLQPPAGLALDVFYFKTVDLTLIPSAVKNGAVCLDGSPPAYHIDRGVGEGAHKWLVHIEGGGWCDTTENCLNRTKNIYGLGSSKIMQAKNFTGLLGDNQQFNPDFYNWNRVFVRYCDGASFTGNSYDPVNKLHYKGAKVFSAIVKDLLGKGMRNATNCFYPQYVVPHVETPLFLINSAYDSYQVSFLLVLIAGFRSEFVSALPKLGNGSFRGMFVSTCVIHCQSQLEPNWVSDPGFRLENKTMAEALGSWTNGRSSVQIVDDNDVPKICLTPL